MKKVYKILFVILLIVLLKIVFQSEVFGVELWVYDQKGYQLSDGDEIKYNIQKDSQVKLYICFDVFDLHGWSVGTSGGYDETILKKEDWEQQSECQHGHENEFLFTGDISSAGEAKIVITCKSDVAFGIGDTKTVTLNLVVSNGTEEMLREELDSGYYETYLHGYDKNKLVNYIVNRSYRNYTNNDTKDHNLAKWIKSPQFSYNTKSFNWTNETLYQKLELQGLELECIAAEKSSYWNVGETWKFNYTFYYLPDSEKLIFAYSQNLIKDKNGEEFESGSGKISEEDYDTRIKNIEIRTINLTAKITGERSSSGDFDDILDKIKNYKKPSDLDSATSIKIENAASKVLTAITNVGIVASIIIIAVLGIKYMLGSLEEKAEFKKDMIPYLIGACLLFGVTAFVKIFMQWGEIISDL